MGRVRWQSDIISNTFMSLFFRNRRLSRTGLLGRTGLMLRLLFFCCLFVVLVTAAINAYVYSKSRQFILGSDFETPFVQGDASAAPSPAIALLLGASVYSDGSLSPLLKERVETAIWLYKTGRVAKILVTGDNSTPSYNEVVPIKDYLLEHGLPGEDVFADFAGFDTYDSVYRARDIFGAHDVLVVTQSFHLPRALYMARSVGLNAYGVPAGLEDEELDAVGAGNVRGGAFVAMNPKRYHVKNNIREIFATVKAFVDVQTGAKPRFLGRPIPIEGDGRDSLE